MRPTGATSGHVRAVGGELGQVENDDYVSCLLRLVSGARVVLEASRVAVGEQNDYGFEIHGTTDALFWDFRRMGELGIGRRGAPAGPADEHGPRGARCRAVRRLPARLGLADEL